MEFNEKIKALRLARNATLEEIGHAVGVSKATVFRWESGEIANLRRDKIYKLAKALGVSPSYLMGWDDDSSPRPPAENVPDPNESHLIQLYRSLNLEGQEKLLDYADDLVASGKYIKNNPVSMDQKEA